MISQNIFPELSVAESVTSLYQGRTYMEVPQRNIFLIFLLRKWTLLDLPRFDPSSAIY